MCQGLAEHREPEGLRVFTALDPLSATGEKSGCEVENCKIYRTLGKTDTEKSNFAGSSSSVAEAESVDGVLAV